MQLWCAIYYFLPSNIEIPFKLCYFNFYGRSIHQYSKNRQTERKAESTIHYNKDSYAYYAKHAARAWFIEQNWIPLQNLLFYSHDCFLLNYGAILRRSFSSVSWLWKKNYIPWREEKITCRRRSTEASSVERWKCSHGLDTSANAYLTRLCGRNKTSRNIIRNANLFRHKMRYGITVECGSSHTLLNLGVMEANKANMCEPLLAWWCKWLCGDLLASMPIGAIYCHRRQVALGSVSRLLGVTVINHHPINTHTCWRAVERRRFNLSSP